MLCDKVVFLTGESVIKTTNITDMDYSEQIKVILYVDNASKALSLSPSVRIDVVRYFSVIL